MGHGAAHATPFFEVLCDAGQSASHIIDSFPDTQRFLELLAHLDDPLHGEHELLERRAARGLFDWEGEIVVCRAPGRLDVMGGIADYSGSLVLQMPIEEACHVAVQRHRAAWHYQQGDSDGNAGGSCSMLRIVSLNAEAAHRGPTFEMKLSELRRRGKPLAYAEAREFFGWDAAHSWAAYVAGALVVLQQEQGVEFEDGLSILVHSDVPEGKGVSSSAAVEVATMSALAAAHGIELRGRQLALLCQKVENHVVGAPCGVMDQMASALGHAGQLLALRCQPAEVQGAVAIPAHVKFWGVDSGIRHSVGGSDYGAVRVGTFMGLRIISQVAAELAGRRRASPLGAGAGTGAGLSTGQPPPPPHQQPQQQALPLKQEPQAQQRLAGLDAGKGQVEEGAAQGASGAEPVGGGYLANVAPSQFAADFELRLPLEISGANFLRQYGSHWDHATAVDPAQTYAVRTPASHPIYENFRVHAFRQILMAHPPSSAAASTAEQLEVLGELMYQSHASYSRCGLGCEGTDRLVELVRQEHHGAVAKGEEPVLFGAKITGGGCGGTVCVLGLASDRGEEAVERIIKRYAEEVGHQPKVFLGSSSGAAQFGHLRLRRAR